MRVVLRLLSVVAVVLALIIALNFGQPDILPRIGSARVVATSRVASAVYSKVQIARRKIFRSVSPVKRQNAALIMLMRNAEISDALWSMRQIEDRFNHRYKYPWILLNDEPFDDNVIRYTRSVASGEVILGQLPSEHWSLPAHINVTKMEERMLYMVEQKVPYGGSLSYRHMCRFFSGFFFKHPLLEQLDWYWRVEPGVRFYCDIEYDPFEFMAKNNKQYGFVIAMNEIPETIPTLWDSVQEFFSNRTDLIAQGNNLGFITTNGTIDSGFNGCHFWSNMEIGNLNFWRSEAYSDFFRFLDQKDGFFYERWGDAPIHSIAASIMLSRSKIHHFTDFGYFHPPWGHCPFDEESHASGRCVCSRRDSIDLLTWNCIYKWWIVNGKQKGDFGYEQSL